LPVFAFETAESLPLPRPSSTTATASSQPLSVLVAYENLHTRLRAIEACRRTTLEQSSGVKLACSWWSFELLKYPALAEAAACAALDADVIVYSIRTLTDVPAAVKAWADKWVKMQRGKEGAFVVLTEATESQPDLRAPALLYLQNVASKADMTFFLRIFQSSNEDSSFNHETLSTRANAKTGLLEEILSHHGDFRCGGINE
jgi:hypothetical protein